MQTHTIQHFLRNNSLRQLIVHSYPHVSCLSSCKGESFLLDFLQFSLPFRRIMFHNGENRLDQSQRRQRLSVRTNSFLSFHVLALLIHKARVTGISFNHLLPRQSLPWNIKDQVVEIITMTRIVPPNQSLTRNKRGF